MNAPAFTPEVNSDRAGYFIRFPDAQSAYAAQRAIIAEPGLREALRAVLPFAHEIVNERHPAMQAARVALAKVQS